MSVKAQTTSAARHGRAGRGVPARRKRYCRRCDTRVSRSAGRCGYCGSHLLGPARVALLSLAGVALLSLLGCFLIFY